MGSYKVNIHREGITKKFALAGLAILWCMLGVGIARAGDTDGFVSKIVVPPITNGKHIVRIYFSSYTADRWGCLQGLGYIEANDGTPYADSKALDRFITLATVALTTSKKLSIDSPSTNPCTDANMFALIQ